MNQEQLREERKLGDGVVTRQNCLVAFPAGDPDAQMHGLQHADVVGPVADGQEPGVRLLPYCHHNAGFLVGHEPAGDHGGGRQGVLRQGPQGPGVLLHVKPGLQRSAVDDEDVLLICVADVLRLSLGFLQFLDDRLPPDAQVPVVVVIVGGNESPAGHSRNEHVLVHQPTGPGDVLTRLDLVPGKDPDLDVCLDEHADALEGPHLHFVLDRCAPKQDHVPFNQRRDLLQCSFPVFRGRPLRCLIALVPVLIEFLRDVALGHHQRPKPIGGVLLDMHLRVIEVGTCAVVQPIEDGGLSPLTQKLQLPVGVLHHAAHPLSFRCELVDGQHLIAGFHPLDIQEEKIPLPLFQDNPKPLGPCDKCLLVRGAGKVMDGPEGLVCGLFIWVVTQLTRL
mmetsp:Transcript_100892/g.174247  ORF Transcript_100892/g.174247 Transcript_100892/m.174247 type:complete len:392 (-) Transcript_100892:1837-3012(-)